MGRNGRRRIETQHFVIRDDKCAMKVGTDALLLGAWTNAAGVQSVVDIGSGSAIVLLMVAQRSASGCALTGIELDPRAAAQGQANADDSPFAAQVVQADALVWLRTEIARNVDLFVCNPPFFRDKPLGPDPSRNLARHDLAMPIETLLQLLPSAMSSRGRFSLVWPDERMQELDKLLAAQNWLTLRRRAVKGHPEAPVFRHLLELAPKSSVSAVPIGPTADETPFLVEACPRQPGKPPEYSEEYIELLAPYFPQLRR